ARRRQTRPADSLTMIGLGAARGRASWRKSGRPAATAADCREVRAGVPSYCGIDWRGFRLKHLADNRKEETGGPPAYQDARQSFNAPDQTPLFRQHEVAVTGRRVRDCAE